MACNQQLESPSPQKNCQTAIPCSFRTTWQQFFFNRWQKWSGKPKNRLNKIFRSEKHWKNTLKVVTPVSRHVKTFAEIWYESLIMKTGNLREVKRNVLLMLPSCVHWTRLVMPARAARPSWCDGTASWPPRPSSRQSFQGSILYF